MITRESKEPRTIQVTQDYSFEFDRKLPENVHTTNYVRKIIPIDSHRILFLFNRVRVEKKLFGCYETRKFIPMYGVAYIDQSSGKTPLIQEKQLKNDIYDLCLSPDKKYYITATSSELLKATLVGDELQFESLMSLIPFLPKIQNFETRCLNFIFMSDTKLLIVGHLPYSDDSQRILLIDLEIKQCIKTYYVSRASVEKINQTQFAVLQEKDIYVFDITKLLEKPIRFDTKLQNSSLVVLSENRLVSFGFLPGEPTYWTGNWCMQTRCLTTGEEDSFPIHLDFPNSNCCLLTSPIPNKWFIAYNDSKNASILAEFEWGRKTPHVQWDIKFSSSRRGNFPCSQFWNPIDPGQLICPTDDFTFSLIDSFNYLKYFVSLAEIKNLSFDLIFIIVDYLIDFLELSLNKKKITNALSSSAFFQPVPEVDVASRHPKNGVTPNLLTFSGDKPGIGRSKHTFL